MAKEGTILVVDDNKGILSALNLLLGRYFKKVITISNPNLIDISIRENNIDVVLLDMNFSAQVNTGNEGIY
ncbi:MAG: sigma-54-dependent Fis family transcriptional regulator, partial [Rikenellaceae bacterium]